MILYYLAKTDRTLVFSYADQESVPHQAHSASAAKVDFNPSMFADLMLDVDIVRWGYADAAEDYMLAILQLFWLDYAYYKDPYQAPSMMLNYVSL